jgi:TldD protein
VHPGADPTLGPDDPALKALALRALDAARAAGATYADVRFTADRTQIVSPGTGFGPGTTFGAVEERGTVYVAVRALAGGAWGMASAPDCTPEMVGQLAREAAAEASVNTWSTAAPIVLDDHPPTETGRWSTPLVRDPFQVSVEEKIDFLHACLSATELMGMSDISLETKLTFRRQEKIFASTSGAYVTQTLSWVGPCDLGVTFLDPATWARASVTAPTVPLQSGGYELLAALRPLDRLPALVDELHRQQLTAPVQVGRYEVVFDAHTTAALVAAMIGQATEMDRVRGDELSSGRSSFLSVASLGTHVAHPTVTVTGSRSLPNGPATTGWDDEGVTPGTFPIVQDGVLVDFATSRSDVTPLREWYATRNQPVRSHGCATANSAADFPVVYPPDLTLHPSAAGARFDTLVSNVKRGVAVLRGDCTMDRDQCSGQVYGTVYDIRDGRLGRYLGPGAVLSVRSSEVWRNIIALGGASSAAWRGFISKKGQPEQEGIHGVLAVPMTVRDLVLINAAQG